MKAAFAEPRTRQHSYDDEIDQSSSDIYSSFLRLSEENNLSKGTFVFKLTLISTSNAIAQVLGNAEESPVKKGAEKTHPCAVPHIREVESRLGALQHTPERSFFGKNEAEEVVKMPVDETFKRTKKDTQILLKDDGSEAEYIYKEKHNKKMGTKDGRGVFV